MQIQCVGRTSGKPKIEYPLHKILHHDDVQIAVYIRRTDTNTPANCIVKYIQSASAAKEAVDLG